MALNMLPFYFMKSKVIIGEILHVMQLQSSDSDLSELHRPLN